MKRIEGYFLQVIANLPFNITTQVVKKLLPLGSTFSHIILLLQVLTFLVLLFDESLFNYFHLQDCGVMDWQCIFVVDVCKTHWA